MSPCRLGFAVQGESENKQCCPSTALASPCLLALMTLLAAGFVGPRAGSAR